MIFISFKNPFFVLLLLWLVATGLNLSKAFHIDDTFHLVAAQWIQHNPLKPMSGYILWDYGFVPISNYNQPPFYFYLVALVGKFFGYYEIPLHLLQSGFTLLAIFFFHKIAQLFVPRFALISTAFFVLNPAFLVNQNLMVDVPLLSLHLVFIYLILKRNVKSEWIRYCLAGLFLSLALLIKYTSLPLVIVFIVQLVLKKHWKYAVALLIPVGVLTLWAIANIIEFNSIHLFRPTSLFTLRSFILQSIAFVIALGAIMPFSIAYLAGYIRKYNFKYILTIPLILLLLIVLILLTYLGIITDTNARRVIWILDWSNATLIGFLILSGFPVNTVPSVIKKFIYSNYFILVLWGAGIGSFIVLFAPFMATRHILLILPVVIILGAKWLVYTSQKMRIFCLVFTTLISFILGISDWIYADTYRQEALVVRRKINMNATIWTVGYWGWQWYSKQAGMKSYIPGKSIVKNNDYFVIPVNLAQQNFKKNTSWRLIDQVVVKRNFFTFFSGSNLPGMYFSDYINPPYTLSKSPVDTIQIYQVQKAF